MHNKTLMNLNTSFFRFPHLLFCLYFASVKGACLTTERYQNGSISGEIPMKAAEIALINSGPPMAISYGALAAFGLVSGVDITPMLYHGAWLANAKFVPALEVNYTFCQQPVPPKGTEEAATKASCPCDSKEKFYTAWSNSFAYFTCRFGILSGITYSEARDAKYLNANAMDVIVGFGAVVVFLGIVTSAMTLVTWNYYRDGKDSAKSYGRCGKCPQNKIPCLPARYWMNFPGLIFQFCVAVHVGIAMTAFSAFGANDMIFAIALSSIAIGLPLATLVITCKIVRKDASVMYVSTNKYSGWRDSDGRSTTKTWRMSRIVNRYGAFFSNLKQNRWWYTSYRLIFNLIEAAVVLGIPLRNDFRSAIVVGLYFTQAIIFLVLRPYRDGIITLFEMLQMFHNVFVYMSSTLYIQGGIFNAQDILSVETDGIEQMMMTLGSVMCVLHMLRVFALGVMHLTTSFMVCQTGLADRPEWDRECMDKVVVTSSEPNVTSTRLGLRAAGSHVIEDEWVMKKSQPSLTKDQAKQSESVQSTQRKNSPGAELVTHSNPLRRKLEERKKQESMKTIVEQTPKAAEPNPEPSLPSGWEQAVDPGSNMPYYYNSKENKTQWERPTA